MDKAAPALTPEDSADAAAYPALRLARRAAVGAVGLFALAYYNLDLLPMVGHTVIPLVALVGIGAALGAVAPGRLPMATFVTWWVVALASLLRRSAVSNLPLGSQIFDGVLKYYPTWGVWAAEILRLGVYLWALWLGGRLGRRLRGFR
jgi:hypothetical protein